jgi:hypothetical protein
LELASLPTTTPEERKRLLSFVICGGGPTGVEFAAELRDMMAEDVLKYVSRIRPFVETDPGSTPNSSNPKSGLLSCKAETTSSTPTLKRSPSTPKLDSRGPISRSSPTPGEFLILSSKY